MSVLSRKPHNQQYIYHNNLRGDVVSVTDYSGNINAQYHYNPWGNQISYSGTLSQPFRYAGYYYDEETGLYYLKNRYYSPTLGRFLTKDGYGYIKYGNPQTLNLYAYTENNPVSNTDPSGHIVPLLAAGAAALAPEEAAAITATKELVNLIGDRINADKTFRENLRDIENSPENWEETGYSSEPATGLRNRGGESIEEEFTNKYTGEKLWKHTLKNRNGEIIDQHYRPYPKQ